MDSPSNRTLHLLSLLQAGGDWSVAALAERLEVSQRTVRRDTQRLRELGYDVQSRPGPGAGYQLRPGTKIPPLLLSADEVATIITSLLVLETWAPDDPTASVARSKLEQTLPPALRRRAAATAISTQILQEPPAPVDWALVGILSDAVAQGARVGFDYTDQSGKQSARVVEPHRHLLRNRQWYVVGFDLDRGDWRLFRLDRMQSTSILPGAHSPREFPFASIESWLASDFGRNHLAHIPDARRFQPRSHECTESASLTATDGMKRKVNAMTDSTDDRTKVAELVKKFRFAMFVTTHSDGTLVAHPLTVQEAEFDGDLWFIVSKNSSPIRDLAADSHANVSLSSNDAWVSLSGTARLVDDREKLNELWNPMVEAWFPDGPDDPAVGVLKFSAESAEYWDTPGGKIATAFSLVKSKITGERYDGGESGKVDL